MSKQSSKQTHTHRHTDSERHNYTMNAIYLAHKSGIPSHKHSLMFHHVSSQPSCIHVEGWHEILWTFNQPSWPITQPKLYKHNEIVPLPFSLPQLSSDPSCLWQHEGWHATLWIFNQPLWPITQIKIYQDNEICSPFHFSLPQLSGDPSSLGQPRVISSGLALNYWEPLYSTHQPHFSYLASLLSTFHHPHIIIT